MDQSIKDEKELLSRPGDTILETLAHMKMRQTELAERMGKTPSKVNDIISGKEPITVNTALQLEKVLNIDAQFWLNREILYRERLSRIEQEEALEGYLDWVKQQPIKELKRFGYIKTHKIGTKMASEVLQFYGVVSPVQWENIYIGQYVNTDFKKSTAHRSAMASMAAWLRIGEIEMRKIDLPPYSKDAFKKVLREIKTIVLDFPDDFATRLQEICAAAGVAIVYTICLPDAPISGATRWIAGNPVIQLTGSDQTNDHFLFTFFHGAAHILLHGKKNVFMEDFEGVTLDEVKEEEADYFSRKSLLPNDFLKDLPDKITESDVIGIAKKYKTHPAIVVGRLQNLHKVSYSFGADLKVMVVLDDVIKNQFKR